MKQKQNDANVVRRPRAYAAAIWSIAALVAAAVGCQQKMADQPSYRPLVPSRFFADGRASRPLVTGTVSRDSSPNDSSLESGRKPASESAKSNSQPATNKDGKHAPSSPGIQPDEFVTEFPFPITSDVLARGQQRYTIYCSVCHDAAGTGNGKIVQRGYTKPPSYLTDNSRQFAHNGFQVPLRDVPAGYLFDVATNGFGAMADYSSQVSPRDRWAIAAYIRTLQLSQNVPLDRLPPEIRAEASHSLETTP
ncbi:MAG TPA: cytochrome c [Lacipirellulaceae bacterium]|nr:cytochrome c [Lacipirellulaceae bacterium]